jgi:hypothetical protein
MLFFSICVFHERNKTANLYHVDRVWTVQSSVTKSCYSAGRSVLSSPKKIKESFATLYLSPSPYGAPLETPPLLS